MATSESKQGFVSGFVRGCKETKHGQISFKVCGRKFLVSKNSYFADHVHTVRRWHHPILIVFRETGRYPTIEGMVNRPLWCEVAAAMQGANISEVHRAGAEMRTKRAGIQNPP